MNLGFSRQIFENSNIKFHENPSRGSRFIQRGQADMTKLTVAFRNFVKAFKSARNLSEILCRHLPGGSEKTHRRTQPVLRPRFELGIRLIQV